MQTGVGSEIQIRKMRAADLEVLVKLVHSAYRGGEAAVSWKNEHDIVSGPRITPAGLQELLGSNEALVLVAERSHVTDTIPTIASLNSAGHSDTGHSDTSVGDTTASGSDLCGCVLIEKEIGRAHGVSVVIGMLAVGPNAQNLGLGRSLVAAAEAASREHFGAVIAHMHVASVRSELMEWYQRLGYVRTGETKPFPGPEAGIQALQENLQFVVIEKKL